MSNDTFTECEVLNPDGTKYVFAVTVTYDTDSGVIQSTDYQPVMRTEE